MRIEDCIIPDWPAPSKVKALITTRKGGMSLGAFASFNLSDHVGDDAAAVAQNRALLHKHLPAEPKWLKLEHGVTVADLDLDCPPPRADAAVARTFGTICGVLTADCLPILLCNDATTVVAVAHAGWRGLAAGVIEATVGSLAVPSQSLLAYLGPAIGPRVYEVGDDVRQAFVRSDPRAEPAFSAKHNGKWLADLYCLAHQRLGQMGVTRIYGGGYCTFTDKERFFSYRRDGVTGRMAALIWLA